MKIVIIGGVAAGAKVAAKTKRDMPEAQVEIYTQDTHVSYSACGLPYYIEGNFEDWQKLIVRSVEEFEKSGIKIYTRHKVTRILPLSKKVAILNLENGKTFFEEYDKLVIATGASPIKLNIKGEDLKNVYNLKTLEDGINIREKMQTAEHITLIGSGYISIGLLEAFVKNGKRVTLIEKKSHLLPVLDEEMSELIENYILENSNGLVNIIKNDTVSEFMGNNNLSCVITQNGLGFHTDMAIVSVGITPNTELAREANIEIGETGAIKVNSRMQTSIKNIYACGDCAEKFNIISNTPMWLPLGSTANKEGRIAASNITGQVEDFEGILGSVVTRFKDLSISMSGLSERYAKELHYDTISVMITKKDKAGYMPEVENITLKIVADKRSHRILGAQAIGCIDADKKINEISVGLNKGMTIEDFLNIDLTYAPPFSTSIDILHSATRLLKTKLETL